MKQIQLGIVVGAVGVVCVARLIDAFLDGNTHAFLLDDGPVVIALIVAAASLFVSYRMFFEQRLIRQAGTDPVILVYLGSREDARILSTLEIENVGAGAARNVQVRLTTDIGEFHPDRIITNLNEIKTIRTIPQGKSVSYNFGTGRSLLAEPKIPPL